MRFFLFGNDGANSKFDCDRFLSYTNVFTCSVMKLSLKFEYLIGYPVKTDKYRQDKLYAVISCDTLVMI